LADVFGSSSLQLVKLPPVDDSGTGSVDPSAADTIAAVGHVSETVAAETAAVVAVVPPPEVDLAAVVVGADELDEQPGRCQRQQGRDRDCQHHTG
jgi:hypothetical protein